jgi:DNA-directed RNA polymerase subunit L
MKKKIIINKKKKIIIYTFCNQDHTLGNILRSVIEGNPEVDSVGYNIPHPSEKYMNLKISSKNKNSFQPCIIGLKNCGETGALIGNIFDYLIENNSRKRY